MSAHDPAIVAEVFERISPENWSVDVRDGDPVFGITVAGAAEFVLSHVDELISLEYVLGVLAELLPAGEYLDVAREVDRRREVSADV